MKIWYLLQTLDYYHYYDDDDDDGELVMMTTTVLQVYSLSLKNTSTITSIEM